MTYVFIFLLQNILILLSCVHIQNYFIFKLDFGWTIFLVFFTLLAPRKLSGLVNVCFFVFSLRFCFFCCLAFVPCLVFVVAYFSAYMVVVYSSPCVVTSWSLPCVANVRSSSYIVVIYSSPCVVTICSLLYVDVCFMLLLFIVCLALLLLTIHLALLLFVPH